MSSSCVTRILLFVPVSSIKVVQPKIRIVKDIIHICVGAVQVYPIPRFVGAFTPRTKRYNNFTLFIWKNFRGQEAQNHENRRLLHFYYLCACRRVILNWILLKPVVFALSSTDKGDIFVDRR